jgi:hypothetical protein
MLKPYYLLIPVLFLFPVHELYSQASSAQYLAAGSQMSQAKEYEKAIPYYQAAIQLDSGNAAAYRGLADAYYFTGRKKEALEAYEKASALNPGDATLVTFVQSLKASLGAGAPKPAPNAVPVDNSGVTYRTTGRSGYLEMNIMLGAGLNGTITQNAYGSHPSQSADAGMGLGGGANGFYMFDSSFGVGLQTAYYSFSRSRDVSGIYTYGTFPNYYQGTYSGSVVANLASLEILAMVKYKFGGADFWPYLLAGGGLSILMAGTTNNIQYSNGTPSYYMPADNSSSEVEPMAEGGAGFAFRVGPDVVLFLEAKYAMVIVSGSNGGPGESFSYIPLNVGANFDL